MVALVVGSLGVMWAVEGVDTFLLDDGLERHGIEPRDLDGLEGILFAPFLHGDWNHLISNSIPYLALGALVFVYGMRKWLWATAITIISAGVATWLFARPGVHIGASILIFGWLGFLLASGWFERSFRSIGIAVIVALLYGGLLWGILPTDSRVSWEGHLFGALAGAGAAWYLSRQEADGT
jgi:membrane associated rhomboid family serine protease